MLRLKCLIALTALALFVASPALAGPIKGRQKAQDARIDQGVASGSVTKGEQAALRGQQRAIDGARSKALSNDGKIGKKEAKKLTKAQNQASKHIKNAKQNDRSRR